MTTSLTIPCIKVCVKTSYIDHEGGEGEREGGEGEREGGKGEREGGEGEREGREGEREGGREGGRRGGHGLCMRLVWSRLTIAWWGWSKYRRGTFPLQGGVGAGLAPC